MKYRIVYDHSVNIYSIGNCYYRKTLTLDEAKIRYFHTFDTLTCPLCGNPLYCSEITRTPSFYGSDIDFKPLLRNHLTDNETDLDSLVTACKGGTLRYQKLVSHFLFHERRFHGVITKGKYGCCGGLYEADKKYIYLRQISAENLYHELGRALRDMNQDLFPGFDRALKKECKQVNTVNQMAEFLENKTKLLEKYNLWMSYGTNWEPGSQSDIAYHDYFEDKMSAASLFPETLDIFKAISKGTFKCYTSGIGHGIGYFKRPHMTEEEFFSHFLSLHAVDDELQLDILSKAFPKSFREYDLLIDKLNERYP